MFDKKIKSVTEQTVKSMWDNMGGEQSSMPFNIDIYAKPVSQDNPYAGDKVINSYQGENWVYASVRAISENIASLPILVKSKDDKSVVDESKVSDLFKHINNISNSYDFTNSLLSFLELRGEAVIIKDKERGLPRNIWVKDPAQFKYILNADGTDIAKWEYEYTDGSGKVVKKQYKPSQIVFMRYFSPFSNIRGMSPLEAARSSLLESYFAKQYNINFFQNNASVGGVLESENQLGDKVFKRLQDQFDKKYAGAQNAGKTLVLEGGIKYNAIQLSHKDMEYLESRKMSREEILSVFRVPPSEVGVMESMNYANSEQSSINFWTKTLLPKVQFIERVFNEFFFDKYEPDHYCEFDLSGVSVLQSLLSKQMDIAVKMRNLGYPLRVIDEQLDFNYLKNYDYTDEELQAGDASIQVFSSDKAIDAVDRFNLSEEIGDFSNLFLESCEYIKTLANMSINVDKKDFKLSSIRLDFSDIEDNFNFKEKLIEFASKVEKDTYEEIGRHKMLSSLSIDRIVERHFDELDNIYKLIQAYSDDKSLDCYSGKMDLNELKESSIEMIDTISASAESIARSLAYGVLNSVRYYVMLENDVQKHMWVVRDNSCRKHSAFHLEVKDINDSFGLEGKYPSENIKIDQPCTCVCVEYDEG